MLLHCKEKRCGRSRCAATVERLNATLDSAGFQHTHSQVLQQLEARQPDPPSTVPTSAVSWRPLSKDSAAAPPGECRVGRRQKSFLKTIALLGLHKLFCLPDEPSSAMRKKISAQRQEIEQINNRNWCY